MCCRLLVLVVSEWAWLLLLYWLGGGVHEPPTKPFTVFCALDTWMWYWIALSVELAVALDAMVAKRRIPMGSMAGSRV